MKKLLDTDQVGLHVSPRPHLHNFTRRANNDRFGSCSDPKLPANTPRLEVVYRERCVPLCHVFFQSDRESRQTDVSETLVGCRNKRFYIRFVASAPLTDGRQYVEHRRARVSCEVECKRPAIRTVYMQCRGELRTYGKHPRGK